MLIWNRNSGKKKKKRQIPSILFWILEFKKKKTNLGFTLTFLKKIKNKVPRLFIIL